MIMKKLLLIVLIISTAFSIVAANAGEYLGRLSVNPYAEDSTSGTGADNYRIKESMEDEYTTGGPKLYDSEGNFRGNLNGNEYDPDSISNPYGRYGSEYSNDSINNPYGAGSEYLDDSPNNPYGEGWVIIDE